MLIVIIPIIVFLSFLIVIVYLFNKQKREDAETSKMFRKLKSGIKEIGYIKQTETDIRINTEVKNEFLGLYELRRLFRYSDSKDFWIEFIVENISNQELIFNINSVEVQIDSQEISANTILLFEKVEAYLAPPYGNRYFNILSYNDFLIGKSGQKYFTFLSKFKIDNSKFKEEDFIKIEIEINTLDKQNLKKVQFIESFKNMKFKNIQLIEGKINWHN